MVLSVIETEEECKKAPNTLGGVHSLHINPPHWSKPEAASTTAAPAASTACRSPREAGDSPGSHLLGVQVVIDLPPLLIQDESCHEASSTAAHSRPRHEPKANIITRPAAR